MQNTSQKFLSSIVWRYDHLLLLDQRKIPKEKAYLKMTTLEEVVECIRLMVVRGAPAIALSGMFGLTLFFRKCREKPAYSEFQAKCSFLLDSRPTAVNLKLALDRLNTEISESVYGSLSLADLTDRMESLSNLMFKEDYDTNRRISENGAALFSEPREINILTHCNTGAIATAGIGTALGVVRALRDRGFKVTVYADETRPYLQGSRLTSWEMMEEGIECFIIADSMAAWLMKDRRIDAVIVGADRIAANGDTANKIGTYGLSILAKSHGVPFYVCASETSFDFSLNDGSGIVIEMRNEDELTQYSFLKDSEGKNLVEKGVFSPKNARALNPGFDVTPSENITGIITEKGIISPVNRQNASKIILNGK